MLHTYVSNNKRNKLKCIFICPQTFGPLLYYFHTTYRLPFWPTFSPPPKSLNNKFQIFPFNLYPLGAQNKVFELQLYTDIQTDVQMQTTAFTCPFQS